MHTFGAPFPCEDYVLRKGGKTHHPQNMKTTFHEQPPDINTFDSLSHNLCLRYLDLQKLYNICTFGLLHMWAVLTFPRRSALKRGSAAPGR